MDDRQREPFAPGTLGTAVAAATARALASGALLPFPTGCTWLEEGGVRFLVRVLASLARKATRSAGAASRRAPPAPR